jgi:uncharacterized protein YgiB involved in biofilm formation
MKRSRTVSLVLLGAVGAGALALGQCTGGASDQTQTTVFTSIEDCTAAGTPREECERSFNEAIARNVADAPRFERQPDCERDFGRCTETRLPVPGGGLATYFVPAMVGFAVARAFMGQGPRPGAQPLYNCPPERQRPDGTCYSNSSGRSYYFGSSSGATRTAARAALSPLALFDRPGSTAVVRSGNSLSSVTRGGFSATGSSVSRSSGFSSSS